MRKVYIETLGCAKNRVDSEIMMGSLFGKGYGPCDDPAEADVIIVNTCGFLSSAVSESIERIISLARFKSEGDCQMLVAAGCMIERYREQLIDEIPEIDGMLGTSDYTKILNCVNNYFENKERQLLLDKMPSYSHNNQSTDRVLSTQYHAYVKIAEGCSNMCSFCNIPRLRGKQVSRTPEDIIHEINKLLETGVKEINLISQDSSSYGRDLKEKDGLFKLTNAILESTVEDFWLRIFYSYPNRYPLELLKTMRRDERLVPYMDLPFQHVSDSVLKAMNRRITRSDLEKMLDTAKQSVPDIALRTTFIVGFPNETEKDFKELLEFVRQGYFNHIGVFTYSHEDNIRSYELGDLIPEEVKIERRDLLMAEQQKNSEEKNRAMVGQTQKVLVEGKYEETDLLLKGRNRYQGVDVDGAVLINEGTANEGQFHLVKITDAHPYDLIGGIVE